MIGFALAVTCAVVLVTAQDRQSADGAALFRERCADCHGADAKGGRGPDLTRLWASEDADQRAMQAVRSGVPGSIMPASTAPDEEIRAIVGYLRSISAARAEAVPGNPDVGEQIFVASCSSCHRIAGRGGFLGPDLSRIAATQSSELLTRAIRDASATFAAGYEPVTLITHDGRQIRGVRKAEDAFSIQIMDVSGRLQGFSKDRLWDVSRDRKSLMPDFGPDRLSESSLTDLLAYLAKFRSAPPRRSQDVTPADPRGH
jgi:putative heme-binding domain-containing protein